MNDEQSGAFFIGRAKTRAVKRKKPRGARRPVGSIIAILLLLSAAICVAAVFFSSRTDGGAAAVVKQSRTYYFLATAETSERSAAVAAAGEASSRGGAGYIYNDGKYRAVAAVYEREADVKTLVALNPDSHYFALTFSIGASGSEAAMLDYLFGEWFNVVYSAATELDKGHATESAAEYAVTCAAQKLKRLAHGGAVQSRICAAVYACPTDFPIGQPVLSRIRYINVSVLAEVYASCK